MERTTYEDFRIRKEREEKVTRFEILKEDAVICKGVRDRKTGRFSFDGETEGCREVLDSIEI